LNKEILISYRISLSIYYLFITPLAEVLEMKDTTLSAAYGSAKARSDLSDTTYAARKRWIKDGSEPGSPYRKSALHASSARRNIDVLRKHKFGAATGRTDQPFTAEDQAFLTRSKQTVRAHAKNFDERM
jgi:hypothetical protein